MSFDLQDIANEVNKDLKSNIMFDMTKGVSSNIKHFIPTGSTLLNLLISGKPDGGFPSGRVIEILAAESVGKTTISAQAIANSQKSGGIGVFVDTEHSFDEPRAIQLGVDLTKFIYSNPEHLEQALEAIQAFVEKAHDKYPNIPLTIVWDSVAGTPPKCEIEGNFDDKHMAPHARILSQAMRTISKVLSDCNAVLICINQEKTNIGPYGSPIATIGGKAIKFHASVRVQLKKGKAINEGGKDIGHLVTAKTIKNKIFRPNLAVEIPLFYESGLNEEYSWLAVLESTGYIKTAGAWKELNLDGESYKFQKSNFLNWLEENEEVRDNLSKLIKTYNIMTGTFNKEN